MEEMFSFLFWFWSVLWWSQLWFWVDADTKAGLSTSRDERSLSCWRLHKSALINKSAESADSTPLLFQRRNWFNGGVRGVTECVLDYYHCQLSCRSKHCVCLFICYLHVFLCDCAVVCLCVIWSWSQTVSSQGRPLSGDVSGLLGAPSIFRSVSNVKHATGREATITFCREVVRTCQQPIGVQINRWEVYVVAAGSGFLKACLHHTLSSAVRVDSVMWSWSSDRESGGGEAAYPSSTIMQTP